MKINKVELINFSGYSDNGELYLSLVYRIESDTEIRNLEITKIKLGIKVNEYPIIEKKEPKIECYPCNHVAFLLCGGNRFLLCEDEFGDLFRETINKRKSVKLTMREIEEKLGYPIEIISEEEEKNGVSE